MVHEDYQTQTVVGTAKPAELAEASPIASTIRVRNSKIDTFSKQLMRPPYGA